MSGGGVLRVCISITQMFPLSYIVASKQQFPKLVCLSLCVQMADSNSASKAKVL